MIPVNDLFYENHYRAKKYLNDLGIHLDDYHLIQYPYRTEITSFDVLFSTGTCMVAKIGERYFIRYQNRNFSIEDQVICFVLYKTEELGDIEGITKRINKQSRLKSGNINVLKYNKNRGWCTVNTVRIRDHKPINSKMYREFVRRQKVIDSFKETEVYFNTNILLHGPPGSGKTRFIMDIATYIDFDIYHISLNSEDIAAVENNKNCIFVIEEVDKVMGHDGQFIENAKVNESQILCFLDGDVRCKSTVVIMTCNDLDRIMRNPVFSREGRINKIFKFGALTFEQCKHIIDVYYRNTIGDEEIQQFYDRLPKKPIVTIAILSLYIQENVLNELPFSALNPELVHGKTNKTKTMMYH